MDHVDAVLSGRVQPTVEDFIEWIEEEAFRMGGIGFRTEYANPEEIFADFSMDSSEGGFDKIDRLERCATIGMMGIHTEIAMMERRMQIMKANRPLLARTEVRLDKELLAAGKSQEDIDSYPNNERRLREKVMDLYALKHPNTYPQRGIGAWVVLGPKLDRKIAVTLPTDATLAEVCKLLDGTYASDDYLTVGWHKAPAEKRIWKYHLIIKGQKSLVKPHSTRLLTDADYDHLIQEIKKKKGGENFQCAFITPVSGLSKGPDD